jgi:hypothetical protein
MSIGWRHQNGKVPIDTSGTFIPELGRMNKSLSDFIQSGTINDEQTQSQRYVINFSG